MMHQYGFAFENPPDSSIVLANPQKRKRSPRKRKAEPDAYERQLQILFELDDLEPALDDNWDEESVDQLRCYLLKKTLARKFHEKEEWGCKNPYNTSA